VISLSGADKPDPALKAVVDLNGKEMLAVDQSLEPVRVAPGLPVHPTLETWFMFAFVSVVVAVLDSGLTCEFQSKSTFAIPVLPVLNAGTALPVGSPYVVCRPAGELAPMPVDSLREAWLSEVIALWDQSNGLAVTSVLNWNR
jgi:hypothetical protein